MNKREILQDAEKHRESEVLLHEVNIENYTLAIQEIEDCYADAPHMQEFADQLKHLLKGSIENRDKERVLLSVIRKQLEGM